MDIIEQIESTKFNLNFWKWFDDQPKEIKDKFNYYPSDMAKLYFYNKVWKYERGGLIIPLSTKNI
jgi:hypothetical protein